ncbi:pyridoxal phosphate-dependent aminotransferase [Spongorhabdus nitratireducens]
MSVCKSRITKMGAYSPPLEGRNADRHLLLDFNERTIPVSPKVRQALIDYIQTDHLQTYPAYGDLSQRIAEYAGVPSEQLMITNGSDQGIDLIIRATCNVGDEVIIPSPSFAMYNQIAQVEGAKIIEPEFTETGGFPVEGVLAAVTPATRLIVISNPNNPTGTLVSEADIVRIAQAAPDCAILVDECYFEYTRVTVKDHLTALPNLFITRTFSKTWGLPSIRLGYVMSATENINALLNIRGPYDVNQFAEVAVRAALDEPEYMQSFVSEVLEQSKPLLESFLHQHGIPFWPASANFIFAFPEQAEALNQQLQASGVLVRPKKNQQGKVGLRITLGTLEQTQRLVNELEKAISQQ